MKNKLCNGIFCFFLVFSACGNQQDMDDAFVRLGGSRLIADHLGITQSIAVESNVDWSILESSVPEWCRVEKRTDSRKGYLEVSISPNHTFQAREATLIILWDGSSASLSVTQTGIKNSSSLDWYTFPVNTISHVSFEAAGATKRSYRISGRELFIHPSMREKVYHGNLINNTFTSEDGIVERKQYTHNPVSIGGFAGGRAYLRESISPSVENTNELYDEIKADRPGQNLSFSFQDTPVQYHSYQHLHLLGMGNLGLKLDEIITGNSYLTTEMEDRTGLIYSYCQSLFSTVMDLPRSLIQETIPEEETHKLSYISSIKYGKMAFLVVETGYDYNLSKAVVEKIMKGLPLNNQEEKVKESIVAYYLTFDKKSNLRVSKGIVGIGMYVSDINDQPIIPLSFSINNYSDNSAGQFEFNFELP